MLSTISPKDRPVFFVRAATVLCLLVGLFSVQRTATAEDIRETSSLKFVPADVSFYASCLRNREKFDIVRNSKLVAKLLELPPVKMGLAQLKEQWANPEDPQLAMVKGLLEQPENAELLKLLQDAVSHEIFIYGGADQAEFFAAYRELNSEGAKFQIEMIKKSPGAVDDPSAYLEVFSNALDLLEKHNAKFNIPTTVIGFKLTESEPAEVQIARLHELLKGLLTDLPEYAKGLTREKIGDNEFLTFSADGTMIPWHMIPPVEDEENKKLLERLKVFLSKKTVAICLGVRDGYLLLSIGSSNEHIKSLGQGELLSDRSEFAGLRKSSGERITSIGYASESFMKTLTWGNREIDQMSQYLAAYASLIPEENFDPMVKARIAEDVEELAKDLKEFVPKPGAVMGFRFLNGRGFEGYSYNWQENLTLDASKKLSILDHLGGDPLCFVAGRAKKSPENYALLVKWLKRGFGYWEALGVPQLEEEQRAMYDLVWTQVQPLLGRVDKATTDLLIPAFKDGQTALVVDAKLKSKSWHKMMPPSEKELPMLEVALVSGISDPELVKKAASEYFSVAQAALDKLHEAVPDDIPEIKLPKPESREFPAGTVYFYKLPGELGFDFWLAPNAGLSDQFLVLSLLPKVTLRLLETKPLQLDGPLANVDRPLAAAAHFNFAGMLDALQPWAEYGLQIAEQFEEAPKAAIDDAFEGAEAEDAEIERGGIGDFIEPKSIFENVAQAKEYLQFAFDALRCFQGGSSVTYEEEGALVTHSELRFQDLK